MTSTDLLQELEIGDTFWIQLMAIISVGADVLLLLEELVCGNWAKNGNQSVCVGGDLSGCHHGELSEKVP